MPIKTQVDAANKAFDTKSKANCLVEIMKSTSTKKHERYANAN